MAFNNINYNNFENFSLATNLVQKFELKQNSTYFNHLTVRVESIISLPFAALADSFIHAGLCVGKIIVVVVVTPYNWVTDKVAPKWKVTHTTEISSAMIHLIRTVDSTFAIVLLPLVCLFNPNHASNFMKDRYGHTSQLLKKDLEKLQQEKLTWEGQLVEKNEAIRFLEGQQSQSKTELQNLQQEKSSLQGQLAEKDEVIKTYEMKQSQSGKDLEKLQQEKSKLQQQINEKDEAIKTYETKQSQFGKDLEQFQQEKSVLQQKIDEQSIAIEQMQSSHSTYHLNVLDRFGRQVKTYERVIEEQEILIESLRKNLFDLATTKDSSTEQLEEFEEIKQEVSDDSKKEVLDSSRSEQIGCGKVKNVHIKKNDSFHVYYTGQNMLAEWELKEELKKTASIRHKLSTNTTIINDHEYYLAIDFEEVPENKGVKGTNGKRLFTVKCKKADMDLEKYFTTEEAKNSILGQRLKLGWQVLKGLTYLHLVDYVQGDLKPENLLVYGIEKENLFVRISDFGKAEPLKGNEESTMRGNPRFSPYEFKASKKGEVYSAALVIIRILEEKFLERNSSLIVVPKDDRKEEAKEPRRGIEKYLIEHSACKQINSWKSKNGVSKTLISPGGYIEGFFNTFLGGINPKEADKAMSLYIDELSRLLSEEGKGAQFNINDLSLLLKRMTLSNPQDRPTMEDALKTYESIIENKTLES